MTEQDLIDLGFEKIKVYKEESGAPIDWHYYIYNFAKVFSLISQASDEIVNDNWTVGVFESEGKIQFNDKSIVKLLIEIINKNTIQ
jgi:hypothetical protein